jgi:hypothetical protein
MSEVTKIESLSETEKEQGGDYARWQQEITAGEKELEKFKRKSRKIVKMFRAEVAESAIADDTNQRNFNLFPANVNILQTSLINQAPQPTVDREFKDAQDDLARIACNIMERALASHNNRNFATFNMMKQVVQDMLVPGVGISWHTYHADIERRTTETTPNDPTSGLNLDGDEKSGPPDSTVAEALEYDEVVGEQILDEYVYWEDLIWSPCRCYEELRWIGRKTYLTRDQGVKRFGKKFKKVNLDYKPKRNEANVEPNNMIFQQAVVYEIWDKPSEKVIWFSKGMDELLDIKDDFLELDDFFPCPTPLTSTVSNGQYIPIPDFHYAKDQYRELNDINTRISLLVKACRLAGVYDKNAPALVALISNAAENQLVPVDQWAAFAEKGGIKGVIDWLPLDMVVAVIEQLTKNREDVKNQIYEVTGMSDIIRGASKASETLGAQKIKTAYASMRIQDRQKNVAQYASEVFDLQAQLMRKHMDPAEISKLAQVDFMDEDQNLIQQAMLLLKHPDFILRCKVEADTLSDIDFQAEKQDRMEYMSTITNYLKEVLPTMQGDPIMGPFLMQLLQFSLAGFRVGKKFEGELDRAMTALQQKLANPQPPQPTPEETKANATVQAIQAKSQADQENHAADLQFKQQEGQQKLGFKQQELQLKLVGKQQDAALKHQTATQKMVAERQNLAVKQQAHVQQTAQQVETAGVTQQIARDKMWRHQQQSALDQQHAGDTSETPRGNRGP